MSLTSLPVLSLTMPKAEFAQAIGESFRTFGFAMVKAFVPRYRYDQLMRLGWKVFLPISLAMVVITAFVLKLAGWA